MPCDHELDAEYLYASDADVLSIEDADGEVRVTLALPCPNCGQALSLESTVDSVEEGDFDLPLDDKRYD